MLRSSKTQYRILSFKLCLISVLIIEEFRSKISEAMLNPDWTFKEKKAFPKKINILLTVKLHLKS